MPDEYIDIPIEFDETALYNQAVVRIQETFPEWLPKPGSLVDIVLRSTSTMAATAAEVASIVPFNIFRAFLNWAGQPPLEAVPAYATVRFTAADLNGHVIPALTPVGLSSASIERAVAFQTLNDAVIPPGIPNFIDVLVVALVGGAQGNNLNTVARVDSLGFIRDVSLPQPVTPSKGGVDAETDAQFVTRGAQELETWSETPILGRDFALLARRINGVMRCAWIDNYNPDDDTYNNDKYVTLCPIDISGMPMTDQQMEDIVQLMESMREVNFVCKVIYPTYTYIDITAVIHVPDPITGVRADPQVREALADYLNPAVWGTPMTGRGQLVPLWVNQPIVRYSKIMTVIENVVDVDYAEYLRIDSSVGDYGNLRMSGMRWMDVLQNYSVYGYLMFFWQFGDFKMNGAFPLPILRSVNLTVVNP